jgi:hypothetical protein
MAFSTIVPVPEEVIENDSMVQYWTEEAEEIEDSAAAFFASMGAK